MIEGLAAETTRMCFDCRQLLAFVGYELAKGVAKQRKVQQQFSGYTPTLLQSSRSIGAGQNEITQAPIYNYSQGQRSFYLI